MKRRPVHRFVMRHRVKVLDLESAANAAGLRCEVIECHLMAYQIGRHLSKPINSRLRDTTTQYPRPPSRHAPPENANPLVVSTALRAAANAERKP
jgi:hypothetical protein